ncbi:MAG TPA: helicase C-terminal domain-containing protein, partial [Elusimicrobiota bacterium]|nr:helicase C-terminal domain-containing protein [Elusimicrobiota bacterium]
EAGRTEAGKTGSGEAGAGGTGAARPEAGGSGVSGSEAGGSGAGETGAGGTGAGRTAAGDAGTGEAIAGRAGEAAAPSGTGLSGVEPPPQVGGAGRAPEPPAGAPGDARQSSARAEAEALEDDDGDFVVSQLREGALERLAHLFAGRISFLLDSDVVLYTRRVFVGEEVEGVPYQRLTLCPMSPFHERTLARERAGSGGLASDSFALYDLAFPNPAFAPDAAQTDPEAFGLYRSGEVLSALGRADSAWRAAAGVIVSRGEPGEGLLLSGPFLGPERLPAYSAKYARLAAEVLAALRSGPGKILVFHPRVRTSGVLLLQEVLRMHGLIDGGAAPGDRTLCAVCGAAAADHADRAGGSAGPGRHAFEPARFLVVHSDVDRATQLRHLARFNAPENLEGRRVRVLLGSKKISESLNFTAVRHLLVASLPVDYPTLIQVQGRGRRKGSHLALPEALREIRVRVLVSTRAGGAPSPELQRYVAKGREFLVIQQVERQLRAYAVDAFANFARIRAALGPGGASLEGLPYAPAAGEAPGPARLESFEAYGYGAREVDTLAAVCDSLFRARPVWTYEDLWAAVQSGAVAGAGADPALFDEGSFAAALARLGRARGEPPRAVVRAGRFLVAAPAPGGRPALDVGCHLRAGGDPALPRPRVRLAELLRSSRGERVFAE